MGGTEKAFLRKKKKTVKGDGKSKDRKWLRN